MTPIYKQRDDVEPIELNITPREVVLKDIVKNKSIALGLVKLIIYFTWSDINIPELGVVYWLGINITLEQTAKVKISSSGMSRQLNDTIS